MNFILMVQREKKNQQQYIRLHNTQLWHLSINKCVRVMKTELTFAKSHFREINLDFLIRKEISIIHKALD